MAPHPVRITATDTALHEAFLRYAARVFPRVDFRGWHARGGWTSAYEAHGIADGGELVANASVMRMRLVVGGRELRGAQLGAVGCVPERRGTGLVRPLLTRVLAQLEQEADLVYLYANDEVLDFYPRFGFRRIRESVFELDRLVAPAAHPARRLDLDDAAQRAAWLEAYARAPALAERLGVRDYGPVALWHACNFHRADIHALPDDAFAVAVTSGDTLRLLDLAAPRPFDLLDALPALVAHPVSRVRFGFDPGDWCPQARAVGASEDALFVRGHVQLPAEPFALPALAQT